MTENLIANGRDFQNLLETDSKNNFHVAQVVCNYPMFGDRKFGHYLGIVNFGEITTIAGSLAPFGIYETPFAQVDKVELTKFIEISNKHSSGATEVYSISV